MTGLQIGETMLSKMIAPDEIAFELAQPRGKFLKIKADGTVGNKHISKYFINNNIIYCQQ
jgi:hypothetical protein